MDLEGHNGLAWDRAHFGQGITERIFRPGAHVMSFQNLADNGAALTSALAAFSVRRPSSFTLHSGLGRLTAALAAPLDVEYHVRVTRVERPGSPTDP